MLLLNRPSVIALLCPSVCLSILLSIRLSVFSGPTVRPPLSCLSAAAIDPSLGELCRQNCDDGVVRNKVASSIRTFAAVNHENCGWSWWLSAVIGRTTSLDSRTRIVISCDLSRKITIDTIACLSVCNVCELWSHLSLIHISEPTRPY